MAPKKRNKENRTLPARWRFRNGSFCYQVPKGLEHEWDGKKEFKLGRTLTEAYRVWFERTRIDEDIATMSQAFDRYLLEVVPDKAHSTQQSDIINIRFLRPVFGHLRPSEILPVHAYRYHDIASKERGKVAAKHAVSTLRHVLSMCVKWGVINSNALIKQVTIENQPSRTRLVEDWEIQECLNLKPKIHSTAVDTIKLYLQLKLMTGLTRIDILQLKLSDLKADGIHSMRQKTAKKVGKRTIYKWTDELRELVTEIKQLNPGRIGDVYLFVNRKGLPYFNEKTLKCNGFDSIWQRFMIRVLELTKVSERFHEHDLRASVASESSSAEDASDRLNNSIETARRVYRRKPIEVIPLKRK